MQKKIKKITPTQLKTVESLGVKLDMIHDDVLEMRETIEMLKEDYYKRKAAISILTAAIGALGVVIGWVVSKL